MTKHILTQDSITAAKALVSRLCDNGHVRMSVPVDFARDEDMLICALINAAEKSLAPTGPAEDGYAAAFYEIASVLGIGARADTPENVFRNEMLPRIVALASREASPASLTGAMYFDGTRKSAAALARWANSFPEIDKGEFNSTYIDDGSGRPCDDLMLAVNGEDVRVMASQWAVRLPNDFRLMRTAALASPQVAPALQLGTPLESECRTISGFLSDVMTAAGLVEHGKQSKPLAERMSRACMEMRSLVCGAAPAPVAPHPDDLAVDRFAVAMKEKLAAARAKGRGGWERPDCTREALSAMLREHVEKGDPRDVANFAMFLHQRGEGIAAPVAPTPSLLPTDAMIHAAVHAYDVSQATPMVRMRCALSAALARWVAPTPAQPSEDTARLDYLQQRGSTVHLLPGNADFYPMRFCVGGLHAAVSTDLREAIDAAMSATLPSEPEGEAK